MSSFAIIRPLLATFLSSSSVDKSKGWGQESNLGPLGEKREFYPLCYAVPHPLYIFIWSWNIKKWCFSSQVTNFFQARNAACFSFTPCLLNLDFVFIETKITVFFSASRFLGFDDFHILSNQPTRAGQLQKKSFNETKKEEIEAEFSSCLNVELMQVSWIETPYSKILKNLTLSHQVIWSYVLFASGRHEKSHNEENPKSPHWNRPNPT